jgi:hypothetical protein
MTKKDLNYIAAVEKAITDKYGEETVQNPRTEWGPDREKEHLLQMKELYEKTLRNEAATEKVDINGIKVSKKLLNREPLKKCPTCGILPRKSRDDISLLKFQCCYTCYIQYVEGREDRWEKGWRPNETKF